MGIKMSSEPQAASNSEEQTVIEQAATGGVNMESVHRIAKLPVVESTINAATNVYEKVKDSNSVINWTLSTAENTVHTAVEMAKPIATPVAEKLEGPIKKVDSVLCSGLDFVEEKVPAVKLPPHEMYEQTKHLVEPAIHTACALVQPAIKTANTLKDYGVHKVEEYLQQKRTESQEPQVHECPTCIENAEKKRAQINKSSSASASKDQ